MRILQKIADFYIDASIHVALAIASLVYVTQLDIYFDYSSAIFFGTIVAYNFLKYIELIAVKKVFSVKIKAIIIFTILSFLAFLFFFFGMERKIQLQLFLTGILVLVYPFLRKQGWLKLFLVSFVITITTALIPFSFDEVIGSDWPIVVLQRFFFVTSLMVPFEIYDSQFDKESLHTLPQRFGIRKAKLFGILLVIPFLVLEFLKVNSSLTVIPVGIITVLAIHFTSLKRNEYYTSFWVESIPIVWLILLLVFNKMF